MDQQSDLTDWSLQSLNLKIHFEHEKGATTVSICDAGEGSTPLREVCAKQCRWDQAAEELSLGN